MQKAIEFAAYFPRFYKVLISGIALGGFLFSVSPAAAEPTLEKRLGPDPKAYASMVERGIEYLKVNGQAQDGSFSSQMGSGITALATTALLRNGRTPKDPVVAAALQYLKSQIQPGGGIHKQRSRLANYETCVGILCFTAANADGRYDKIIKNAEARVRGLQWDKGKGKHESDFSYGGVGYGEKSRPDLSNTGFLIDALKACGAGENDEAIQKSLVFVSRCQNLETSHNTTPFAAKVNDGGFYYTCVLGRQDESRQTPEGGLRSYGAMSYTGLRSLIYAGLTKDDPRLKAAVEWIRKHYDVTAHPGMGNAGLYYYYHTLAKAMDALDVDYFEDAQGVRHDWRKELAQELARRQRDDGSWVNDNRRWFETDPNLVTAYALLTLSYCRPEEGKAD